VARLCAINCIGHAVERRDRLRAAEFARARARLLRRCYDRDRTRRAVGLSAVAATDMAWLAKQAKTAHFAQRITEVPSSPDNTKLSGQWDPDSSIMDTEGRDAVTAQRGKDN
jgi:hypothetical protein